MDVMADGSAATAAQIAANFADAHPPLNAAQALVEANRCYFCYDAPCVEACPTAIDIPGFIRGIATGNLAGAAYKILDANIFGGACARVCPTEILCEGACVREAESHEPIAIGALQRVATDWQMAQGRQPFTRAPETGRRIAVIGAGPAGLACAHALARLGHHADVFDAKPKPGGLNEYGIAAYKLPDDFAASEIAFILSLGGITLHHGERLGETLHLATLRRDYNAIFLALGQAVTNQPNIPGETLPGVQNAVDFIAQLRQTPDKSTFSIGRRVVVIGGGNTAIDAATQAKFLGAETVTILYRRGAAQMSATRAEQNWAQTHGVTLRFWSAPQRITQTPDGLRVSTDRDHFDADLVLKAVGQKFAGLGDVAMENGRIAVQNYATSCPGIFAGGDCVAGADLTVQAVQDGKRAAAAIHDFLT